MLQFRCTDVSDTEEDIEELFKVEAIPINVYGSSSDEDVLRVPS